MSIKKLIFVLFSIMICSCILTGCGGDTGLTLNGISLSKYKIVAETEDYGSKLAVEELKNGIYKLTDGTKVKCEYGAKPKNNVIYIANGPSDVGTYSIKADGNKITVSGPGIYGRRRAVQELLSMFEEKDEVTIDSVDKPIFELPKAEKMIANGEISIGFIGDSVTTETEATYDPWPYLLMEKMRETYTDTNFKTKNVALNGKTTAWGAENIGELLLEERYCDLIFISLGNNDRFYEVTGEQTKANYMSMIEQIYAKNPNAEIVFVMYGRDFEVRGIEGLEKGEISDYMSHMLLLSEQYDIPIIEVMSAMYDACVEQAGEKKAMDEGWKYYFIDDVHPFGHGQVLYGNVVWTQLKAALNYK